MTLDLCEARTLDFCEDLLGPDSLRVDENATPRGFIGKSVKHRTSIDPGITP